MVAKILALVIFLVMFFFIVTEKFERHYVTLACGAVMLILVFGVCMRSPQAIFNTLNFHSIFTDLPKLLSKFRECGFIYITCYTVFCNEFNNNLFLYRIKQKLPA